MLKFKIINSKSSLLQIALNFR